MKEKLLGDENSLTPLSDHFCLGVYSLHLEIQRTYKSTLDRLGLTYSQYLVMNLLWMTDGQRVSELAGHLDLEPSTLTPLLKRLEIAGFIERKRSRKDERQVRIMLTQKGNNLKGDICSISNVLIDVGLKRSTIQLMNEQVRKLCHQLKSARMTAE